MVLTPGQNAAYRACVYNPQPITIIQGKAGTGKSYLIEEIVAALPDSVVLTPTNMAASVYRRRATTLHSFFYGELDDLDNGYQNPRKYVPKNNMWFCDRMRSVKTLIFDEISMVRADYFEMMNVICQGYTKSKKPFGGLNVIIVGDMYQLPPVVEDEEITRYLMNEYGGIYYFNSHVIQNNISSIRFCELTDSKRQETDPSFVKSLDAVRIGADVSKIVEALRHINSRVVTREQIPDDAIAIASSNAEVMRVNRDKLAALPGSTYTHSARISIRRKNGEGNKEFTYSSDVNLSDCEQVIIPSAYEAELTYKIGARVMFTSSNKKAGYINGDIGTIKYVEGSQILVEKRGDFDLKRITPTRNYRYKMRYDAKAHELERITPYLQQTIQYPLKLAYAFTIHKSQGQSYDAIYLDLESPVFAAGQLYVAISRAKTLQGLYLTKPIAVSDVLVDPAITEFLNRFNPNEYNAVYQSFNVINHDVLKRLHSETMAMEQDEVLRKAFAYIIKVADRLWSQQEHIYARLELNKLSGILRSYYQLSPEIEWTLRRNINKVPEQDESSLFEYATFVQQTYSALLAHGTKKSVLIDKLH